MRNIKSRLENVENAAKNKLGTGATITFQDAEGNVLASHSIPGKESIVFIDDVPEDDE